MGGGAERREGEEIVFIYMIVTMGFSFKRT